jgi:hypothetical protein
MGIDCGLYDTSDPMMCYHADVTLEMQDSVVITGGGYRFASKETKAAKEKAFFAALDNFCEFHEKRMT